MKRIDLIKSDEWIIATNECIVRSGRSVKEMRKELDDFYIKLRNELLSNEGKERAFSLKEALGIWYASNDFTWNAEYGPIPNPYPSMTQYFKDKFGIDL